MISDFPDEAILRALDVDLDDFYHEVVNKEVLDLLEDLNEGRRSWMISSVRRLLFEHSGVFYVTENFPS